MAAGKGTRGFRTGKNWNERKYISLWPSTGLFLLSSLYFAYCYDVNYLILAIVFLFFFFPLALFLHAL